MVISARVLSVRLEKPCGSRRTTDLCQRCSACPPWLAVTAEQRSFKREPAAGVTTDGSADFHVVHELASWRRLPGTRRGSTRPFISPSPPSGVKWSSKIDGGSQQTRPLRSAIYLKTKTINALGKHQHNQDGRYRRERGDSLARNLAKEYPELRQVDPRTKLETLRERFNVDSLNKVREALRKR